MASLPHYHRIYLQLRESILDGTYKHGARIPGEIELSTQLGVSRTTTKRALNELEHAGLVTRERGRGTRVKSSLAAHLDGSLESLHDSNRIIGRSEVRLLDFSLAAPPPDLREIFAAGAEDRVWRIERIRSHEGEPFAHVLAWVPESIGRTFSPADLEASMLVDLIERSGARVAGAKQKVSATIASPHIAEALRIDQGAPLLRVDRTVFSEDGVAVEHFTALFRAERYSIGMELSRRERSSVAKDGIFRITG